MISPAPGPGWRLHPRAIFWAAAGGLAAGLVAGIVMHATGMMTEFAAGLVRSENVWAGWLVHLAASLLVGAGYGALVSTRSYAKGAIYGATYGLAVGLLLVLLLGNLLARGFVPVDGSGATQVVLHVLWGAAVGLVQASGLRADDPPARSRRRIRPA